MRICYPEIWELDVCQKWMLYGWVELYVYYHIILWFVSAQRMFTRKSEMFALENQVCFCGLKRKYSEIAANGQVCMCCVSFSLPFITATADGPKHIDTSLTRAKFEELCSDLLDR